MSSLEFTERMAGQISTSTYLKFISPDNFENFQNLEFTLTIKIVDIDTFLYDPNKTAQLSGQLLWNQEVYEIENGIFNLFVLPQESEDINTAKEMHYYFQFLKNNKKHTFFGYKKLTSNEALSSWKETTTLYFKIFESDTAYALDIPNLSGFSGELKISTGDFIHQLTTFKTNDDKPVFQSPAFLKFITVFSEQLWIAYAPFVFNTSTDRWNSRPYALGTTIGVPLGSKELIQIVTEDKIFLELQRFCLKPTEHVVLLVHGLTLSTDMFIMPEIENLVSHLHKNGFEDIWSLDWRGSCRFKYNLEINNYNIDYVAHYDLPAAIRKIREVCGENVKISIISHCVGAMATMASIASGSISGLNKVVANSVSLTPQTRFVAIIKLLVGPFIFQNIFGYPYISPKMPYMPGHRFGKFLYWTSRIFINSCKEPACHMISLMWGWGFPTPFHHHNLSPVTHRRLADLFGGISFSFYRHMRKMILAKKNISDGPWLGKKIDYFELIKNKKDIKLYLTSGSDNLIFPGSNKKTYDSLKEFLPNMTYEEIKGYGHQDVFMGKNSHIDFYPKLIKFLRD